MADNTTPIPLSVDAARRAMLSDAAREAEAAGWKIIQLATLLRDAAADPTDGGDQLERDRTLARGGNQQAIDRLVIADGDDQ